MAASGGFVRKGVLFQDSAVLISSDGGNTSATRRCCSSILEHDSNSRLFPAMLATISFATVFRHLHGSISHLAQLVAAHIIRACARHRASNISLVITPGFVRNRAGLKFSDRLI